MSIFSKVVGTVFGNKADKDLKVLLPYITEINSHYTSLSSLTDQELKDKFLDIKSEFSELIRSNKNKLHFEYINRQSFSFSPPVNLSIKHSQDEL